MATPEKSHNLFRERHPAAHRALNQLGLILGPATVITLLCQFVDMPARDTAVLCLCLIAVLAIILNHSHVNRRLPASAAVAGFIVFLAFYYFTYENVLLKDTGLQRYYRLANDYLGDVLTNHITEANDEIWFFGTNFHISAEDKRSLLLDRLDNGVEIRYLVFDPYSDYLPRLASDFNSDPGNAYTEAILGLRDLVYLREQWSQMRAQSNNPGNLEIRLFDTTPRSRAYIFDPNTANGKMYLVPYINMVNSPESPGFLFKTSGSDVAKAYSSGIRKLWDISRPLSEADLAQLESRDTGQGSKAPS